VKEEFESTFSGGRVVKVENSQLVRLYNPYKTAEPTLVFLRNGVPLIYDDADPDDADSIFNFFSENRDPIARELDDSNFEHLTQASTGATTGDWLVQFYDNACVDCQRLHAIYETIGAKLKMRMNVARVNRATKGIQTAKRFKIETVPSFILVRQGKFYRYNLKKYDIESLVGFAQTWFKNVGAEKIIVPKSPFENLIDGIVENIKNLPRVRDHILSTFNDYPLAILLFGLCLPILFVLIKIFRRPAAADKKKPSTPKGEEKSSEPENVVKKKKATKKE
jgi:thiol-disulfide isomerase/thioredoxin